MKCLSLMQQDNKAAHLPLSDGTLGVLCSSYALPDLASRAVGLTRFSPIQSQDNFQSNKVRIRCPPPPSTMHLLRSHSPRHPCIGPSRPSTLPKTFAADEPNPRHSFDFVLSACTVAVNHGAPNQTLHRCEDLSFISSRFSS